MLQYVGIRQKDLAQWFGCSDRNLRSINQAVRTTRRGDGKTGRPRQVQGTPAPSEGASVGYSAYAGLWLLVPLILESRLLQFAALLAFAGPIAGLMPWQWVLTVMALAWLGFSRPQHLDDLCDVGIALFTGRRTVLDAARARQGMKAIPAEAGSFSTSTELSFGPVSDLGQPTPTSYFLAQRLGAPHRNRPSASGANDPTG